MVTVGVGQKLRSEMSCLMFSFFHVCVNECVCIKQGLSNIRPEGKNWPGKDPNSGHGTALENMKDSINLWTFVFTTSTTFMLS